MTAAPASVPDRVITVVKTEWLSPAMVRVIFTGEALEHPGHTDTYIKLIFDGVRRAYTVRWVDGDEFAVDFVVHGDEGLAGPWAAAAVAGDAAHVRWAGRRLVAAALSRLPPVRRRRERFASHSVGPRCPAGRRPGSDSAGICRS